jgi:hypothetical protein
MPRSGRHAEKFLLCPEPVFHILPVLVSALCPVSVRKA